jgi:hypothetical protein
LLVEREADGEERSERMRVLIEAAIVLSVGWAGVGCQGDAGNDSATTRFPDAIARTTVSGNGSDTQLLSSKDNQLLATLHVGASEANWQDHLGKVRTIRVDEELQSPQSLRPVKPDETLVSALPHGATEANQLAYNLYRANLKANPDAAAAAAVPYDYPLGDPACHNEGGGVICCMWQNYACCMHYTTCGCMDSYSCCNDGGCVDGGGDGCPRGCYYAQSRGNAQLCDAEQAGGSEQSCGIEQACGT